MILITIITRDDLEYKSKRVFDGGMNKNWGKLNLKIKSQKLGKIVSKKSLLDRFNCPCHFEIKKIVIS